MLSQRLQSLGDADLIERVEIHHPIPGQVFKLTATGEAFRPAMIELIRWGARFLFPQREGETFESDWLRLVFEAYASPAGTPSVTLAFVAAGHESSAAAYVAGGPHGTSVAAGPLAPDATITADPAGLLGIMSGRLPLDRGLADGRVIVEGDLEAARQAPLLFGFRA